MRRNRRSHGRLTLRAAIAATAAQLRAAKLSFGHGTFSARDEAAYIVLHAVGAPIDSPPADPDQLLAGETLLRIDAVVRERVRRRVPLAYILKEAWLDGVRFYIDERAIVPRSHIAALIRTGFRPWLQRTPRRALDLCTGSGCLAVLLAQAFPHAQVDACDLSATALQVARRNLRLHALVGRVRVARSDLFAACAGRRYDLIISNPPYVTAASMRALPDEYRHEPRMALAAGRDGLDIVHRILADAARHLTPGGILVCEVGAGRRTLERAYPRTAFWWPDTGTRSHPVFVLERNQLIALQR